MQTEWQTGVTLFSLLLAGCSSTTTTPTHLDDLKMPVLIWERSRGLCGSGLALDGEEQLWVDEGGCEDGGPALSQRGRGAPEKVEALRRAFDALPRNTGPSRTDCKGNLDSFSKRAEAESFDSHTCASGTGTDLIGLEEPYLSAAERFLALP